MFDGYELLSCIQKNIFFLIIQIPEFFKIFHYYRFSKRMFFEIKNCIPSIHIYICIQLKQLSVQSEQQESKFRGRVIRRAIRRSQLF